MVTEDYVSYEVAKLLKEKGFDVCTKAFYTKKDQILHFNTCALAYYAIPNKLPAPTHQMTLKWLREIHGIDVVVEISDPSAKNRKYYCVIWDKNCNSYILDLFDSFEETVETALKYALENLIK